jgi:hypothetical protein
LLLGAALLVLAAPRVVADLRLLRPMAVVAQAEQGVPVDRAELATAAERAAMLATSPVGARAARTAGRALVMLAEREGQARTMAGRAELGRAAALLERALALAPGDRYGWCWLVYARWESAQPVAAALAWRAAVLTGAFDPALMFLRAENGITLWPYMDAATRQAFGQQLFVHWRWGPDGLTDLLDRFDARSLAAEALSDRPDVAADLMRRKSARP